MSPGPDFQGVQASASTERVRLLRDLARYLAGWQRTLASASRPTAQQVSELNQPAAELQSRSSWVGFGGLAHHIGEYTRLLGASADLGTCRTQLEIVAELAAQAQRTLSQQEQRELSELDAPEALRGGGLHADGLAPPPLITVTRPLNREAEAALRPAEPARALPLEPARALPLEPARQPTAPPRESPGPIPQFAVKNMLGLRAFRRHHDDHTGLPGSAKSALLGLPGLRSGPGGAQAPRSSKPPPLVAPDISGLPPLASNRGTDNTEAKAAWQSSEIKRRLRPDRALPAAQTKPPARQGTPPRPARRGRARDPRGTNALLWVGIAAAVVVLGLGTTAFLTLGRHPENPSATIAVGNPTRSTSGSIAALEAKSDPGIPRERLLADDERFKSLLAQVHGHGGTESPELRSLLNEQAALASKALYGKCNDGSPACKAWSGVRELMVGDPRPLVKRRRGSDTETTRSRWMAGLKMPGIPVEDDPRVLRVFEFYTENPVGRETFQSMLFRCGAYRDLIQSTLIRFDLPPDLMALTFTESGCEPSAKSPVGAVGLWQFMPETGRAYHLRIVEGTIDERYSPFKSTEAAIKMLADLRQKLGSWDLVFASYDLGPFGLLARLEKAGGDASFWDLVDADLLPDETANYSPTVEAIALILANLQRLKFAGIQIRAPQLTADLEVPGGTRLGVVARAAATSVTQLHALNLDFSGDLVPSIPGGSIAVQVPKDVVWQARDAIKELLASKDGADQCVAPSFDWGKQRFTPEMEAACERRLGSAATEAR